MAADRGEYRQAAKASTQGQAIEGAG